VAAVHLLALERAVSHERRVSLTKFLVEQHLLELNGLGDQIRYVQGHPEEASEEENATIQRRCLLHLQSVELLGAEILPLLASWAESSIDEPEDAFGLGFILESLQASLDDLSVPLEPGVAAHALMGRDVANRCR